MKSNIKLLFLFSLLSVTFFSCIEEDLVAYDEADVTRNDPYKQVIVNTPVISFVAGEPGYDIEFLVITPDSDEVKEVDVYATFTSSATGSSSNEILLGTYAVPAGKNTVTLSDNLTYEELTTGMTVDGGPLPASQVEVPVGSKWDLRLDPVDSSKGVVFAAPGIIIGVLSPFAGIYTVIESSYHRIGADGGTWNGEERFIGSVDANTFSYNDHWGPFAQAGFFTFDLNEDNTITVLDDPSQLFFSGNEMLTCQEDGGIFTNAPCDGSNVLEPSDDGKHILKLTYGYFTITGDENEGAREFYELLEKKVD